MSVPSKRANRFRTGMVIFFTVVILLFVAPAVGLKLYELSVLLANWRRNVDAEGIFAATPLINYGLASLGFLCMLIWATINGMFHDIESPKESMLENERMLDERQQHAVGSAKPL